MELSARYEVVDTIATGDFATVYRARDRDLGREVAVKQIHHQFLTDERQLARYWQEAQLLASLQHPNIVTIYDIVRPRGWLIMELMQRNLSVGPEGRPIDLDFLRVALAGSLGALGFLHDNGVIHGDVKPSNLLVDAQNRVKLGDFGLARRASDEGGSLLKGTTKYMAPELISPEFGPVGPASDLYSLGFSAYELICGAQFETLFPTLSTFGRDKQIAWMMWHAARDRSVPQIGRVLEGVPEDLARVIQRLVVKDPARRYHSAEEVLADLRHDPLALSRAQKQQEAEAAAAAAEAAKKKRKLRFAAILAMCFSVMLCITMLLPKKAPPPKPKPPEPTRGVVREASDYEVVIAREEDNKPKPFAVRSYDRVFINQKPSLARELRPGDRAVVKIIFDESGRRITEIHASRPVESVGHIAAVEADEGQFTLAVEEGDDKGKELQVSVPGDLKIALNPIPGVKQQPVELKDLRVDDRVVVHHVADEVDDTARAATELVVQRVVEVEGVLRDRDSKRGQLTVAVGEGEQAEVLTLPVKPACEVVINDRRFMNERILTLADLQPGDRVRVSHDSQVVAISAYRVLGDAGAIRSVRYDAGMIDVVLEGKTEPIVYIVRSTCEINLGGEPAELADLRSGDLVDIRHDSPDAETPVALSITAVRPADRSRWAILIANQQYDDTLLSPLQTPVADAELLRHALVQRYGVPSTQAELLADESRVRLERGIPDRLARIGPQDKVILYVAGHAYKDDRGTIYLAPKDFDLKRMQVTGLPLQWLLDQFEQCAAEKGKKLLLLDCNHAGQGDDLKMQPATADMLRTLKGAPGLPALRTVTAVASCRAGQRGLQLADQRHGLFAWTLGRAFAGKADKNHDNRLEPTELFAFLGMEMASAEQQLGAAQLPELFLPDDRPPRLSEDAKRAIRGLAALLAPDRVNVAAAELHVGDAQGLAGTEPEPKLLYGLLMLKARQWDEAIQQFEELKVERPELLVTLLGIAWAQFEKRSYSRGIADLGDLVTAIPKPAAGQRYSSEVRGFLELAGRLREFAEGAPEPSWRASAASLAALDKVVQDLDPTGSESYENGRREAANVLQDFKERIAKAVADNDQATATRLKVVERRQLRHYAQFPFEEIRDRILAGLDQ